MMPGTSFVEIREVHKKRLVFVAAVTMIFIFIVVRRLFILQVTEHEKWKSKSIKTVRVNVFKKRGTIYDRNGSKLAISSPVKSCYICPEEVMPNAEGIAMVLSKHLGIPHEKVIQAAQRKSKFVWIKRDVPQEALAEIQRLSLPGVYFRNEFKRIYPYGDMAANVIGCVGQDPAGVLDNKGREGIEAIFDNYLRGVSGVVKKQFEARALTSIKSWDLDSRYFGGISIHLTIDDIIQSILEKEIADLYRQFTPKSAFIIVMNPQTGEILGMANRPGFDNTNPAGLEPSLTRNRALVDIYEPGSTFKIITYSAALEEGVISPKEVFNCQGYINIFGDKFVIKCDAVHGKQTLQEAFANSCNPAAIQIAGRLGREKFYKFIRKFGFGKPTNILPHAGESPGILRDTKRWSALSLGSMAIGQEIGVNGVQLISAASAILNDGVMMKPLLISSLEDVDSRTVRKTPIEPVGRMVSKETADLMKQALRKVIVTGTGKRGSVDGYEILGKTGTSQKSSQGRSYEAGRYFSSFIGFINEPHFKLAVLVVANEPQLQKGLKDIHGGTVAAPAFKNIAEKILMYYNILPEEKKIETIVTAFDSSKLVKVPDLVGQTPTEIKKRSQDGLKIQFIGSGTIVVKQFPKPHRFLPGEESVIAYLGTSEDINAGKKSEKNFFMPMLIGKSMKESLEILKNYNVRTDFAGSGFVSEQKPLPGEFLAENCTVKLNFSMNRN